MRFLALSLVAGLGLGPSVQAGAGMNPISNMCTRFEHQSTVKNNTLYIDGGLETYVDFVNGTQLTGNITLGYNNYLIEIDLSGSWDWTTNLSEKYLDKIGNPNTASSPVLVRGALYQGPVQDDHIYLYGGTTSWWNTSSPGFEPPTSAQYSLWSYDTALAKWNQSDISSASPSRPNGGALAEAPELGLAFYFNGQIDNGSSTETQDLGVGVQIFLDDMIVINMTDRTARNLSTLAVTEGQPTILGGLQYVSGIGEKGILIHLGGLDKDGKFLSMDGVDVFDVNSLYNGSPAGRWSKQATTGDSPSPRVEFCIVTVSAQDRSSYNMYMYGGRGSFNEYFDQVYVLSIPSFTWTKVSEGSIPRYGHTCHVAGNRQMLSVGGTSSSRNCDHVYSGVAVFDMSTMLWVNSYNASATPYVVPDPVVSKIGGSGTGGSTIKYPSAGYNQLFGHVTSATNVTATNSSSTSSNHSGAIAGGVVGGVAGAAIISAGVWLILHHLRNSGECEEMLEKDATDAHPGVYGVFHDQRQLPELANVERGVAEMEADSGVEVMSQELAELPLR